MGMFDYVRCEVPLPDGWEEPRGLQSKDLACLLDTIVITSGGRLMVEDNYVAPGSNAAPARDSDYHGYFHFYGSEVLGYHPAKDGAPFRESITKWHEYRAKFTDGNLVEIEHSVEEVS